MRRFWNPEASALYIRSMGLFAATMVFCTIISGGNVLAKQNPAMSAENSAQMSRCVLLSKQHPEFHFDHSVGADPCSFAVPPRDFDASTATQLELQEWGLPPRPTQAQASDYTKKLSVWKRQVATLVHRQKNSIYRCPSDVDADPTASDREKRACKALISQKHLPMPVSMYIQGTGTFHKYSSRPGVYNIVKDANLFGYLQSFAEQPPVGGGKPGDSDAAVFYGVGSTLLPITFTNPITQCSNNGSSTNLLVSSWVGIYDEGAGLLDQTGILTLYVCSSHTYEVSLFAEEPAIFSFVLHGTNH
jgi:hypothetical protein